MMKTTRYTSHSIQRTDGKFIQCKAETEAILSVLYQGLDALMVGDKLVTVEKDEIKDGCRVTTVSVKD